MAVAIAGEQQAESFIKSAHKLLIDGEWVEPASGKTFPTLNPATEETIAEIAQGEAEDVAHELLGQRGYSRIHLRCASPPRPGCSPDHSTRRGGWPVSAVHARSASTTRSGDQRSRAGR